MRQQCRPPPVLSPLLRVLLLLLAVCALSLSSASAAPGVSPSAAAGSTNTWVVLVSTSRYWFNYRHTANALSLYRIVKAAGVPDSNIILMLPDEFACSPRNGRYPAVMFNSAAHPFSLYAEDDVEVDYRGAAVSVESFLRLLTGRHSGDVAKRQRLLSDERSNVLVYVSGHGGNGFLKFQDQEELAAADIALALHAMHAQRRFHRLLLLSDTCQAESLHAHVNAPGVLAIAASRVGENSYSAGLDQQVGVALIDRFTDSMLDFFERHQRQHHHQQQQQQAHNSSWMSRVTLGDMFDALDPARLMSHPVARTDLFGEPLGRTPLTAFFAADHKPHLSSSRTDAYPAAPLPAAAPSQLGPPATRPSSVGASASAGALRSRIGAAGRPRSHDTVAKAAWPAAAAALCLLAPMVCWLVEQSAAAADSKQRR